MNRYTPLIGSTDNHHNLSQVQVRCRERENQDIQSKILSLSLPISLNSILLHIFYYTVGQGQSSNELGDDLDIWEVGCFCEEATHIVGDKIIQELFGIGATQIKDPRLAHIEDCRCFCGESY